MGVVASLRLACRGGFLPAKPPQSGFVILRRILAAGRGFRLYKVYFYSSEYLIISLARCYVFVRYIMSTYDIFPSIFIFRLWCSRRGLGVFKQHIESSTCAVINTLFTRSLRATPIHHLVPVQEQWLWSTSVPSPSFQVAINETLPLLSTAQLRTAIICGHNNSMSLKSSYQNAMQYHRHIRECC